MSVDKKESNGACEELYLTMLIVLLLLVACVAPALSDADAAECDWLIQTPTERAQVVEGACWADGLCGLEMRNGLISRRFVLQPGQ